MTFKTPYTPELRESVKLSRTEALRVDHDYIGPEHFLLGMLARPEERFGVEVLKRLGVDLLDLKQTIENDLEVPNRASPVEDKRHLLSPNIEAKNVLVNARKTALDFGHNWTGTEHLLLALLRDGNSIAKNCLERFGLDFEETRALVAKLVAEEAQK